MDSFSPCLDGHHSQIAFGQPSPVGVIENIPAFNRLQMLGIEQQATAARMQRKLRIVLIGVRAYRRVFEDYWVRSFN